MKSPAGKGGSGPPPRSGAPSNPSVQAAATKASNPAPQSAKQAERKTPTPTYTPTYTPQSAKQPERKTPAPTYTPKSPKEEERRTTPPPASKTPVVKTPKVTTYPPPKSPPPDYSVPPILTGVPRGRFPDIPTTNQPQPTNQPPPNAPAPVSYPAYSPPPDAPPPQPILPKFSPLINSAFLIKQAPIDTVIFDNSNVNIAQMQDLLYADIGGVELINMSRTDLINGEEVIYSPIKNLPFIQRRYNPNNVIAIQPNETYFSRFAIDLIQRGINIPTIDIDGNITIIIDDVANDEDVEIEILVNGTIDLIEE